MIKAEIVADSIAPNGVRLTTFVLTYPRFIHAEFMTHRMFSRNASSSRAIPVKKQIKLVRQNPAMPIAFAANKSGMQAGEKFGPFKQLLCRMVWRGACYAAVFFAHLMEKLNIHKQYANRILEPFSHITVVVTATDYDNFFSLRWHNDAQPEIHELAMEMWYAMDRNDRLGEVNEVVDGEWHLPFVTAKDITQYINSQHTANPMTHDDLIKMSVARCARVSYWNHDGTKSTLEQDKALYDRLVGSSPIHASPAEHQATPLFGPTGRSGNFRGWLQYRKMLQNENIETFVGPSDD